MKFTTQRNSPPSDCRKCIKLISAARNFSVRPPTAQHKKIQKNTKNSKNNFFNPDGFLWIIFPSKIPISLNFHFSPNLTGKLNFSTDTQFISLDQDKIIPAHKNMLFLTENYPMTIFPNSISELFPNQFFSGYLYQSHL